jgi:hypothetical protein
MVVCHNRTTLLRHCLLSIVLVTSQNRHAEAFLTLSSLRPRREEQIKVTCGLCNTIQAHAIGHSYVHIIILLKCF